MRRTCVAVFAGLVAGWATCGWCADAPAPVKTVALTRVVVKLPPGTQYAVLQKGLFCTPASTLTSSGAQASLNVAAVMDTFRTEFKKAGLNPEEEASLFDPAGASPSEYALAGVITDQKYMVCAPDASPTGLNKMKGQADLTIDWQLYSRLEKQVVARAHTTGTFASRDVMPGGMIAFENRVFAENVRQLAADPAIRKALTGVGLAEGELVKPRVQSTQVVLGARDVRPQPIDKASQSVVVIYAGNTLGSGVLISRDGYVLTDAHVVGDSAAVRLRWADGKETTANVVRLSKERDVALLKTDPGGHSPLPLRPVMPEVGSTVFAVGAPEGQKFEGTVTRGVVSSSRVFEGFTFIQSDVTTGHGASGGPLLDENGYIVGLTESGTHAQTSSGISLFTPVKDAVAFLALDLR